MTTEVIRELRKRTRSIVEATRDGRNLLCGLGDDVTFELLHELFIHLSFASIFVHHIDSTSSQAIVVTETSDGHSTEYLPKKRLKLKIASHDG